MVINETLFIKCVQPVCLLKEKFNDFEIDDSKKRNLCNSKPQTTQFNNQG